MLGKVVRSEDALVAISHFTLPDNPTDTELPPTKRVKTDVTDGCVVLSRLEELQRYLEDPSSKAVADPSLDPDSVREDVLRAAVITARSTTRSTRHRSTVTPIPPKTVAA